MQTNLNYQNKKINKTLLLKGKTMKMKIIHFTKIKRIKISHHFRKKALLKIKTTAKMKNSSRIV